MTGASYVVFLREALGGSYSILHSVVGCESQTGQYPNPPSLEVNPFKTCMSLWVGNVSHKAFKAFQCGRISKS